MARRGFLIRFIDIGLIVLFGFLMISDIEASSRVELAGAPAEVEEAAEEEEDDRAYIVVEITESSYFRVSDLAAVDRPPVSIGDVDGLTQALEALSRVHDEQELETVVLIQPHPESVVQATVDAMDACDRLELAKSLRMDIEIEPAPVGDSAIGVDGLSAESGSADAERRDAS